MEEVAGKKAVLEFDYRKEGIRLFAEQTGAGDSVISVRWCVDQRILDKLKELKEEDPLLLLVVVKMPDDSYHYHCPRDVLRKLVPIGQEMEYIQFQGPGFYKIIATIISGTETTVSVKKYFLQKDSVHSYENSVLGYNTDSLQSHGFLSFVDINCPEIDRREYSCGRIGEGSLRINVSADFFAKEPPEWLKRWANYWFGTKPLDQCQFRGRCILAFTVQPPVMLFWLVGKIVIALVAGLILLLCGAKMVRFSPVLHPLTYHLEEVWLFTREFIFFTRKRPYLAPLAPIFILFVLALTILLNIILNMGMGVPALLAGSVGFNAFCALLVVLVSTALKRQPTTKAPAKPTWMIEEEKKQKKKQEEQARLERIYGNFSGIVCAGGPLKASLDALPKEKRTVHLRYFGLKARLCKPFARY